MSEEKKLELPALGLDKDKEANLRKYMGMINREPNKEKLRIYEDADGAMYLPIEYVEMLLDKVYNGMWKRRRQGQPYVIGNCVVCHIELSVLHPVMGEWLDRTGDAVVPMETNDKGSWTDRELKRAVPAALSEAVKNAAKSLGKAFGRDINRMGIEKYEYIYSKEEDEKKEKELKDIFDGQDDKTSNK